MTTDLSSLDLEAGANTGVEVQLFHPTTQVPLDVFIRVTGIDSTAYKEVVRAQQNRRLTALTRGRNALRSSVEQMENEAIEVLVACTMGWRGLVIGGEEIAYSAAEAKKLYTRFGWIKEQVDVAIADRGLYLGE